jgi:PHS family inorganic phosphate transporter-like MFS transporter
VAWFLYDVYAYGLSIYSTVIFNLIFTDDSLFGNYWQNVISVLASIPAAALSLYFMQFYDLRSLQIVGFLVACVSFVVFALLWRGLGIGSSDDDIAMSSSNSWILFLGYCWLRFGTNLFVAATTFTLPNLLFPYRIRASCNGLAAASGKLGAFVGTFLFPYIYDWWGMSVEMLCLAGIALLAMAVTLLLEQSSGSCDGGPDAAGTGSWDSVSDAEDECCDDGMLPGPGSRTRSRVRESDSAPSSVDNGIKKSLESDPLLGR